MSVTHVTIGSLDDCEFLDSRLNNGDVGQWPVVASAEIGDRVAILVPSIHGKFVAWGKVGTVPGRKVFGKSIRFFAEITHLQRIVPPVPIQTIRNEFPSWGWATYARSYSTVPKGIEQDFWQLIGNPPIGIDSIDLPERVDICVTRIIRDTATAHSLKKKYDFRCQVCGIDLPYHEGRRYIEVHHLRPLGGNHEGPDVQGNMMVLCPNHHALFDLGVPEFVGNSAVRINGTEFPLQCRHKIARVHINYYANSVQRKNARSG